MSLVDVDELVRLLRGAEIEPTAFTISALKGMLDVGVYDVDECLIDLKKYIEGGAEQWD